jgi:hypothetical protein
MEREVDGTGAGSEGPHQERLTYEGARMFRVLHYDNVTILNESL